MECDSIQTIVAESDQVQTVNTDTELKVGRAREIDLDFIAKQGQRTIIPPILLVYTAVVVNSPHIQAIMSV
jgi:hypothetical protein